MSPCPTTTPRYHLGENATHSRYIEATTVVTSRSSRASISPLVSALLATAIIHLGTASPAQGESRVGHEVALGLTGVYDSGYDRGLHYGLSYELSWAMVRATALFVLGDTDPRSEQHWALCVGVLAWQRLRIDVGLHHRTFTNVNFGENLVTLTTRFFWRGLEIAAGYALRFPILDRDQIHSPVVFDTALFEHFLMFRICHIWQLRRGVGLGLLTNTFSRFEIRNLDYPQFALVLTFEHPRIGHFRFDVGIGTAGFFNQGATIDRGFIRFEYTRRMGGAARQAAEITTDIYTEDSREQE